MTAGRRIHVWYLLLVLIFGVFLVRAFYVQVIRYGYYHKAALSDQLKQYQVLPARGIIKAYEGNTVVPIVLNQKLYTIYADPTFIKDPAKVGKAVAEVLGGNAGSYQSDLQLKATRYVILAKKVPGPQKDKLLSYKYPGVGAQQQDYRTYPQGTLAAQLLGFVNNDGKGTYGIEQKLNDQLNGTPGELKAITDARGVPLAASSNNVETQPKAGENVVLTLDVGIQKQAEQVLADKIKSDRALSGSVVVLDPNSGAIKAMANYPSYDPAKYYEVADGSVFNNSAVTRPIEVGSIMKTLTTAAALDKGVIQKDTTYSDPSHWKVNDFTITNIEEDGGPGTRSIAQLLNLSLNTGAVWELMQMGGGKLGQQGRQVWHDYMVNHFMLGRTTGIEQGYEAPGFIPGPEDNGAGIDLTYANTSFGQAMTATTLQMAAAISAVLNGGTYYKPHLISQVEDYAGKIAVTTPQAVGQNIVKPHVSRDMIPLMQYVVDNHNIVPSFDQARYSVGGKTGTAQVAKQGGGYHDDIFNGTYLGFVGGDKPQYVIAVFVNHPQIKGYAGSAAAQPVFAGIGHMLIDHGYVTPKSH